MEKENSINEEEIMDFMRSVDFIRFVQQSGGIHRIKVLELIRELHNLFNLEDLMIGNLPWASQIIYSDCQYEIMLVRAIEDEKTGIDGNLATLFFYSDGTVSHTLSSSLKYHYPFFSAKQAVAIQKLPLIADEIAYFLLSGRLRNFTHGNYRIEIASGDKRRKREELSFRKRQLIKKIFFIEISET